MAFIKNELPEDKEVKKNCIVCSVTWKNRQMSIKLPKNDFTRKMKIA